MICPLAQEMEDFGFKYRGLFVFIHDCLCSYGDDSSDWRAQNLVCAGSFLGWPSDFLYAGWKWEERLKKDNLEYFRASECEGLLQGSQFDPERLGLDLSQARAFALAVRYDLIEILDNTRTGMGGICVSVVRSDFSELIAENPKALKFFGPDPVRLVYKRLIRVTIELLEKDWPELPKHIKLSFTFDSHSKWKEAEEEYEKLRTEDDFCVRRMLKVGHADDKDYAGLQMADLVASEGRLRTQKFLEGSAEERLQFRQMASHHSLYFLGVWTKEHMLKELADAEARGLV